MLSVSAYEQHGNELVKEVRRERHGVHLATGRPGAASMQISAGTDGLGHESPHAVY